MLSIRRLSTLAWRALVVLAFLGDLVVLVPVTQVLVAGVVVQGTTATMLGQAWEHGALPRREWRDLDALGKVPSMVVAAEDQNYYRHQGFDWEAIDKAMAHNAKHPDRRRGASTISQQTARNLFLWQGGGWFRKGLEAWYTMWMERFLSKERILELYCNVAETAPNTFGMQAGARHWYGKDAATLTTVEASRLAALLPSPRKWTPSGSRVQRRARWIVGHPAPGPKTVPR